MLGCWSLIYANETEDLLPILNSPPLAPILSQMTPIYISNKNHFSTVFLNRRAARGLRQLQYATRFH
jgi:hypothetical protein